MIYNVDLRVEAERFTHRTIQKVTLCYLLDDAKKYHIKNFSANSAIVV